MKKLLVTVIGATAAIGAFAYTNTVRFATDAASPDAAALNAAAQSWNSAASGTYVSEYNDATKTNEYAVTDITASGTLPAAEVSPLGSSPSKELSVKTRFGKPLEFHVNPTAAQPIDTGIYFDSLVKFTVCDSFEDQAAYNDAKIIMWLQETDTQPAETNLYVKAGYMWDNNGVVDVSNVVYKCDNVIDGAFADAWHRVTIKAMSDITADDDGLTVPGFAIFIDGGNSAIRKRVATTDAKWDDDLFELSEAADKLNEYYQVFPSMNQDSETGTKLTLNKVGFDGTGSVNDIAFTDVAPFAEAQDYIAPKGSIIVGGGDPVDWYTLDELVTILNGITATTPGVTKTVEVQLLKNIQFAGPVTIDNTDEDVEIVIDLNGCTIENTAASGYAIICESPVTITDTTDKKLGAIVSDLEAENSGAIYVGEAGVLSLQAGTIDGQIDLHENARAILTGGTVKQDSIDPADGYKLVQRGAFYDVVAIEYFTVTFDSNGGTDVASAKVESGNKVARPADPTKAGCVFAGWTHSGNLYDFNTVVTEDITLVAQWTVTWAYYLDEAVDGAYEIDNLTELKAFQANVGTLATAGETFKLTANITLDAAWPGIGIQNGKDLVTSATQSDVDAFDAGAFQGTFDGQNHTISGFRIIGKGDNAEGLDYAGFFNSTYGATIQNLKIQYAGSLFAADTTSSTKESGATFVGVAKNSTLRNLTTVAGTVSCSKGFGGIVGYLYGTTVDSCTNNVNMTSLADNKCGGIAMICQKADCSISNCENNGTMTTGSGEHGGIVGYTDTITINNCKNTAACKMFYHHGGTVTLQGTNTGNATVQSYTGNATPGLNFATVDGNVATFVADNALALNGAYKVMATGATATFAFAEAGTIAFDTNLTQNVTFNITYAQGQVTDATVGGVVTFTASSSVTPVAPGEDINPPAGKTAEQYAGDINTAIAAGKGADYITVPTEAASTQATYLSLLKAQVNASDTSKIDIVFNEEAAGYAAVTNAIETVAIPAVGAALPDVVAGEAASTADVSIASGLTPGLYYSISYCTDLADFDTAKETEGTRVKANASGAATLTTPEKASATQGFYRVNVNVSGNN